MTISAPTDGTIVAAMPATYNNVLFVIQSRFSRKLGERLEIKFENGEIIPLNRFCELLNYLAQTDGILNYVYVGNDKVAEVLLKLDVIQYALDISTRKAYKGKNYADFDAWFDGILMTGMNLK
jgi:hypothetical protein